MLPFLKERYKNTHTSVHLCKRNTERITKKLKKLVLHRCEWEWVRKNEEKGVG